MNKIKSLDMVEKYPVETIYNFMVSVFIELGVPKNDATVCADVLIESDLRGITSHGIGRLKIYYDRIRDGIQKPITKIDIVRDKSAIAVLDGNHGMGHVIGSKAMQMAINKAKEYGIGNVVVKNSTHFGIAGYYSTIAAKKDMIGMAFTNARPAIAPIFGVTPMLGTNPIAFGAPTDMDYPFLFDAATSITQRGKIEVLDRAGKDTPREWAIDEKGEPHTNTKQLLRDLLDKKASMVPLGGRKEQTGGHKGYSLAVIVEILSSALQNGNYMHQLSGWNGDKRVPHRLGHCFVAIDIESFTDINSFKEITGSILRELKNSELSPDQEHIYVAGEKEYLNRKRVKDEGVPINKSLREDLITMRDELGIEGFDF